MKKLTSVILIISVLLGIGITGITASAGTFTTYSPYTDKNYSHYSEYASKNIQNCIDVSEHNGVINWYAVKSAGVTNAIIRVGFRGYGKAGNMVEDDYFTENVAGAAKAGINIGFYFYSQAINTAEAAAEAKFVLARVKKYNFTLPIFYDYEFAEVSSGRLDKAWNNGTLNKAKMTNNAISFCNTIKSAGYQTGVYANASFFTYNLNTTKLVDNGFTIWLAIYSTSSTYGSYWHNSHHDYDYWQYSSTGNVTGLCGVPGQTWLKAAYGGKTGYIRLDNLIFTSSVTAVTANSKGVNMRSGMGTSYSVVKKIPNKAKVTIKSYPVRNCDVNFYYCKSGFTFNLTPSVRRITVSWAKQAKASFYRVYTYNTATKKYNMLAQLTGTSYTDTTLKDNHTRIYLVRWFNSSGKGSDFRVSDNKFATTAPAKVNFKLDNAKTTSLDVTWSKVAGASFYAVYGYNPKTKEYEYLGNTKALKYTVKKLKANTNYTILVRAFNKHKLGSGFNTGDNKVFRTAPPAPKFTFNRYSDKIDISWNKVSGATYYRIYSYDKSAKKYQALANTKALTYTHSSLKANTEYTYLVRAASSALAKSDYSINTNKSVKTLLAKPDFKLALSGKDIKVTWDEVDGVDTYLVLTYDAAQGEYTPVRRTKALSYTFTKLPYNTEYEILVRAYDSANVGNTYSNADHKKITTPPKAPDFKLNAASDSVDISWEAVEGAAVYRVYSYNKALKKYSILADVNALSYKHTALKSNTEYTYLVRAYNHAKSGSAFTVSSNKSVKTLLAKPVVKASASANSVKLSWAKVAGAAEYRIYSYDTVQGKYSRIAVTKNLSYSINNLSSKTQYTYLVRAFTAGNTGNAFTVADNISVTTK